MTPWVRRLLVANVVVFFLTMLSPAVRWWLAFVPAQTLLRPWTVVTYMFVHAGLWHLLFNMLALYFFGPRLEVRLGPGRFAGLYLVSGLVAAGLSALFNPFAGVIGASGAVFGVLVGYARYWPRDLIYIWGVVPVEARWLVIVMAGLSLWFGFTGTAGGIAHFAHLGGFAGGFAYLKWFELRSPARKFRRMAQPVRPAADATELARWRQIDRDSIHPVNREELDRLLEKIDERGVASLTADERAFLERIS